MLHKNVRIINLDLYFLFMPYLSWITVFALVHIKKQTNKNNTQFQPNNKKSLLLSTLRIYIFQC